MENKGKLIHLGRGLIFSWSIRLILTGKPTGKRPLGRARRRWEDNIRLDLTEIREIELIRLRIRIIGKLL